LLNSKSIELFELAKTNKVSLVFINEEGIAKEATPASSSAIRLHLETGIQIIPFNEIIRLRANSNYTAFYTTHIARPIVTSKPLKFYASQFDETQFIRPHRSHLVNKQFIKAYCNENGHHLILNNNQRVAIARRKLKEVLQML